MATQLVLNWTPRPASEFVTSYEVHMAVNGNPFSLQAEVTASTYTLSNPAVAAYSFKIRAKNLVGTGPFGPVGNGPQDVPNAPDAPIVTVVVS